MSAALLLALSLQAASPDALDREGERLGRIATLLVACEPYYAVTMAAARPLADDFERRAAEAGWTARQRDEAYSRGRALERAELGIGMDTTGMTPLQARHHLREMFPRLKRRCRGLARDVPGAISDVTSGNLRVDAAARAVR